ncbi:DUF6875 domain-containing protein [Rhizobium sp. Root1220]|uniref:DUF6875 domain-containing protein n=1 Tax=Rhizobium sp. Root1220 TaxID=1736432 RepID=UPI0006F5C0A1|nr:hypothetical protein [Rhizobium sp. Root1220]KQV78115.1 hypothetical protein ASC90_27195 [Rhizobium sp. Root1220]
MPPPLVSSATTRLPATPSQHRYEREGNKSVWLASERVAALEPSDLLRQITRYKKLLLKTQPVDAENGTNKSIIVVLTDVSAGEAKTILSDVLQQLAVPSYVDDGLVLGGFYGTNDGRALYNPEFRPFTAPIPFLLIRPAVIDDWKFSLEDEDWMRRWSHRFREAAVLSLANELRHLPWRERHG